MAKDKLTKEQVAMFREVQKQLRGSKKSPKGVEFNMYNWINIPDEAFGFFPNLNKMMQTCDMDAPCGTTACIGGHLMLNAGVVKKFDEGIDYLPKVLKTVGVKSNSVLAKEIESLCLDFPDSWIQYDDDELSSYWKGLNASEPADGAEAIERFIKANS